MMKMPGGSVEMCHRLALVIATWPTWPEIVNKNANNYYQKCGEKTCVPIPFSYSRRASQGEQDADAASKE
jgi:hypothetical protein